MRARSARLARARVLIEPARYIPPGACPNTRRKPPRAHRRVEVQGAHLTYLARPRSLDDAARGVVTSRDGLLGHDRPARSPQAAQSHPRVWRVHQNQPQVHHELWGALPLWRDDFHRLCGINRESGHEQTHGEEATHALDAPRGALAAASAHPGAGWRATAHVLSLVSRPVTRRRCGSAGSVAPGLSWSRRGRVGARALRRWRCSRGSCRWRPTDSGIPRSASCWRSRAARRRSGALGSPSIDSMACSMSRVRGDRARLATPRSRG
jgi:hypothetical protein